MRYYCELILTLLAGAVAGAMVLGIAGRAVTAGIALVTGNALNLSLKSVLEVFIVGTLVGALGGILLFTVRKVHRGSEMACGITVGAILFVSSFLLAWVSGNIALGVSSIQLLTMGVVAIMFLVYGVCAVAFLKRFERSAGKRG
jgi:hypothetical protein